MHKFVSHSYLIISILAITFNNLTSRVLCVFQNLPQPLRKKALLPFCILNPKSNHTLCLKDKKVQLVHDWLFWLARRSKRMGAYNARHITNKYCHNSSYNNAWAMDTNTFNSLNSVEVTVAWSASFKRRIRKSVI